MRIVYIDTSIIPSRTANSIHIMKMCQAFARNGHTVTLIVPARKNEMEQGISDVFGFYGVDRIFDISYLPWMKIKRKGYIFGFLAARMAKHLKPDLVYFRNFVSCCFYWYNNAKVVLESHEPFDNSKRRKNLFGKILVRNNFQKLVVITRTLKNYYENSYPLLKDKIQIAPDGADAISDGIVPVVLPNAGKRMQVGYVGHLYKGKGMEVISRLAPLCPWADFHVVGGREEDIIFWKTECKTIDNLIFHGYIPHNETGRYLAVFDVLLLPNQEKVSSYAGNDIGSWTSPLKAFEYMSARKPILASDLPTLREVFENNVNALLAPPDNVEIWAENLKKVCNNREYAERIANQAYNDFIQNYTWLARAREIIDASND